LPATREAYQVTKVGAGIVALLPAGLGIVMGHLGYSAGFPKLVHDGGDDAPVEITRIRVVAYHPG
jgi:hypothetical protein